MESFDGLEQVQLHLDKSEEDITRDPNDYQRLCEIYYKFEQLLCVETKKDTHVSEDDELPKNLDEFFKNIQILYRMEWSLRDVLLHIYGFQHNMVDKEEEAIRMQKTGDEESKHSQEMVIKMSESVGKRKETLEGLLQKDCTVLGVDEIWEALRLTKEWMQELETHFVSVVRYLLILTPQNEAAKAEFQEFKSRLEKIRADKHGRVPISLYKILAILERHLKLMNKSKFGVLCGKKKQQCKDIKTREHLDQLTDMMWRLEFVFRIISSVLASEKNEEEVVLYEAILINSNEDLEEIQIKINEFLAVYLGWKKIRYGKHDCDRVVYKERPRLHTI